MEPTVINATDLRIKTREIMERVKFKGERFLVQTFGQPTAVIISVQDFEKLTNNISQTLKEQVGQEMSLVARGGSPAGEQLTPAGSDASKVKE